MPAEAVNTAAPRLESTFKAREVEGILDLHFYRPIGFRLAALFAQLKMTPAVVSLLAGTFGVIAGHLYFYRSISINIAGMVLHVCANALDNADGQLARLTHQASRKGRIIDSVADHLGFASVYIHLTLRCAFAGASPAIWFLGLGAAISHALQGAAADYYRTSFLYFAEGARVDLDSSSALRPDYQKLSWGQRAWDKLLLALYLNFTLQQEMLAPGLKKLRDTARTVFDGRVPGWLEQRYRDAACHTLKWWRLLMTNTRMLVLFVVLFLGQPVYYFWFELIPLNVLFVYLIVRQEKMAKSLERLLVAQRCST
ncbi:MAG: CDP-alcohol phosphatidyltransferase family protein [Candidatus Udaeobacter sp.]